MRLHIVVASCLFTGWFSPAVALAEHGGPSVHTFPKSGSTLPRNGRIILVSINGQDPALPAVGAKGLALVGGEHVVPLEVIEAHDDPDGYGEAAAVLVPRRSLRPGVDYRLRWSGAGYYKFHWTVARDRDTRAPRWRKQPVFEIGDKDGPGYPDSPLVRIPAVDDRGPLAMRVTIKGKKLSRTAIWDFREECAFTGYLTVGMSGPAKVRITLLDTAGNETPTARSLTFPAELSGYLCLQKKQKK